MKMLTFDTIGQALVKKEIITEDDKELYVYGLRQGCVMLLNILTTFVLGCVLGAAWESMVFLFTYAPIRSFAGGFHAKTPMRCYLSSVLLITAVLLVIKYVAWTPLICCAGAAIAGSLIFLLAPVEDKNKPFSLKEEVVFRKRTRFLLVGEISLTALFVGVGFLTVAACIVMSLITLSFMLFLGKIKNQILEKRAYPFV